MGLTRGSGELIVDAELTTREFGAYIGGLVDAVRDGEIARRDRCWRRCWHRRRAA